MRLNLAYKVAIFDCDGVILQSNQMKSEAFVCALKGEEPELIEEFVEYHKNNGGVSRFVKFEYFFQHIKKQPQYDVELKKALDKYASITSEGLPKCELVPGIVDMLEYFKNERVPCYVASGGAQTEVRECLAEIGLSQYFEGIYGSPETKKEHLEALDERSQLSYPGVYFGDAKSDVDAAEAFKLDFVFISSCSEWGGGMGYCESRGVQHIPDFNSVAFDYQISN